MKYPLQAANGHAGEFFFAYQIAYVLKWPCRLFDIDIGIDAQVEVMSDRETSTGRFVAFQIKERDLSLVKAANKDGEREDPGEAEDLGDDKLLPAARGAKPDAPTGEMAYRYVTQAQLLYWREHGLPVFVALVDLGEKPQMYLHRVLPDHPYPRTEKGKIRIDFHLKSNLFTQASGRLIADAAEEADKAAKAAKRAIVKAKADLKKLLARVLKVAKPITKAVASDPPDYDYLSLELFVNAAPGAEQDLAEAASIVQRFRLDPAAHNQASSVLYAALQGLSGVIGRAGVIGDHGDTRVFQEFVRAHRPGNGPKLLPD